jgi:NADPH:quinone reductase
MKAIVAQAYGDESALVCQDLPEPIPGPGEILVEVRAAGINYADLMQRRGLYPGGPTPPFIPGFEAAGVVLAHGPGVSEPPVGRSVMLLGASCYAEYILAPARAAMPLPEGWTFEQGAAFPIVALTAYHVLHTAGHVQPGENVLIHAAAGGVGMAAVQIAKAAGARVIATASSEEKLQRVRDLGADVTINYVSGDFAAEARRQAGDAGVSLILESVGGEVFDRSLELLAPLGRLVVYGVACGQPRAVQTSALLFENKTVAGFHLGELMAARPDLLAPSLAELLRLTSEGRLRPTIGQTFPLDQAAEAHRRLGQRETFGKLLLVPKMAEA